MTSKSSRRDAGPSATDDSSEFQEVIIQLNAEDSRAFAQALLNPREPNERLRAAARRYRETLGDGAT
jgi:uncharacterized protein (DUF1778 family)